MRPVLLLFLPVSMIAAALASCSDQNGSEPPKDAQARVDRPVSPPPDRGAEDGPAGSDASSIADSGPQHVAACEAMASRCAGFTEQNCGKCQYRLRYDRKNCSRAKPCDNLFVLFTAGTCEGGAPVKAMDQIISKNSDFVTACVAPQVPAQMLPVSLGAPERDRALLKVVLDRLRDASGLGVWSGKYLLFGGCSAGGTRYPVVAARYPDDASWVGTAKTGACFSDGVLSIAYQDAFIGEKLGAEPSCRSRHGRVINAYTADTPQPLHGCSNSPNKQCPCDPNHRFKTYSGDCGDGDCVTFDSIVVQQQGGGFALAGGVQASDFAVRHWRLISEGSSFAATANRCDKDVCPEGPYKALCAALDAAASHTCTFVSKPTQPHCAYFYADLNKSCIDWFRALATK